MILPTAALAARATPSGGLRVAAIDIYPATNHASVTFVRNTVHIGGPDQCISPEKEDFNEFSRIGIDLSTEGGRAALSVATAAFLSGRPLFVQTSDVCLSGPGLFEWTFGGLR
ncbi:hypothetical protein WMF01_20165 [Sorangium sp. So ce1667]